MREVGAGAAEVQRVAGPSVMGEHLGGHGAGAQEPHPQAHLRQLDPHALGQGGLGQEGAVLVVDQGEFPAGPAGPRHQAPGLVPVQGGQGLQPRVPVPEPPGKPFGQELGGRTEPGQHVVAQGGAVQGHGDGPAHLQRQELRAHAHPEGAPERGLAAVGGVLEGGGAVVQEVEVHPALVVQQGGQVRGEQDHPGHPAGKGGVVGVGHQVDALVQAVPFPDSVGPQGQGVAVPGAPVVRPDLVLGEAPEPVGRGGAEGVDARQVAGEVGAGRREADLEDAGVQGAESHPGQGGGARGARRKGQVVPDAHDVAEVLALLPLQGAAPAQDEVLGAKGGAVGPEDVVPQAEGVFHRALRVVQGAGGGHVQHQVLGGVPGVEPPHGGPGDGVVGRAEVAAQVPVEGVGGEVDGDAQDGVLHPGRLGVAGARDVPARGQAQRQEAAEAQGEPGCARWRDHAASRLTGMAAAMDAAPGARETAPDLC